MNLTEALQYLETTARVSCPQITCEQAAKIAELMRDLQQENDEITSEQCALEGQRNEAWDRNEYLLTERDNFVAQLREVEKERDEARDGRDEAEEQANASLSQADQWHREFIRLTKQSARTEQAACGFAWDAGREMAALEETKSGPCTRLVCLQGIAQGAPTGARLTADEFMAWLKRVGEHWKDKDWRKELGREIEVGEDFDASDYERPGR